MRITGMVSVFLIVVIILTGCAATALRTGYLNDYNRLSRGQYLENFWIDQEKLKAKKYSLIQIKSTDVSKINDQNGITAHECKMCMDSAIETAVLPVKDSFILSDKVDFVLARIEIAITQMTPGSVSSRMWAGELGAGHAWVQVEGKVIDNQTNEVIAEFSDRRRLSGSAGLADIGGDAGPGMVRSMLQKIAGDIISELRASFSL